MYERNKQTGERNSEEANNARSRIKHLNKITTNIFRERKWKILQKIRKVYCRKETDN